MNAQQTVLDSSTDGATPEIYAASLEAKARLDELCRQSPLVHETVLIAEEMIQTAAEEQRKTVLAENKILEDIQALAVRDTYEDVSIEDSEEVTDRCSFNSYDDIAA